MLIAPKSHCKGFTLNLNKHSGSVNLELEDNNDCKHSIIALINLLYQVYCVFLFIVVQGGGSN